MLKDKIRSLRKAKGLSLEKLAAQSGSTKGHMCDIEHGKCRRPSAQLLASIADALDVSIEFLVDDNVEKPDQKTLATAMVRKFNKLSERDQLRVMEIIKMFGDSRPIKKGGIDAKKQTPPRSSMA